MSGRAKSRSQYFSCKVTPKKNELHYITYVVSKKQIVTQILDCMSSMFLYDNKFPFLHQKQRIQFYCFRNDGYVIGLSIRRKFAKIRILRIDVTRTELNA